MRKLEAHVVKGELEITQTAFICLGQYSLSGYCQVSSRSTSITFYATLYVEFYAEIPRETLKCFTHKEEL